MKKKEAPNDLEIRLMRSVARAAIGCWLREQLQLEDKSETLSYLSTSATAGVMNFNGAGEKRESREPGSTVLCLHLPASRNTPALLSMVLSLNLNHALTHAHMQRTEQKHGWLGARTCLEAFHGEM